MARRRYLAGVFCPLMYRYALASSESGSEKELEFDLVQTPITFPALGLLQYPHMLYTLLFLLLFLLILTHAQEAATYAAGGFLLWYSKMIPSLLPFMILSGLMIRMGLSRRLGKWFQPVLKPLLRCSPDVNYGVLMGFLCGFPMGARVAAQMYQTGKISRQEARFLLAFCNNIGPVYFCSFVLPLLGRKLVLPYLFGMYGVPLLYGIILRRTLFRELPDPSISYPSVYGQTKPSRQEEDILIHAASMPSRLSKDQKNPVFRSLMRHRDSTGNPDSLGLLTHLDDAVQAGLQSIISLCGYMILFNLLNLVPHIFLPRISICLSPLLEITSGLGQLGQQYPLYTLLLLPFGGLSCIAQTYSMIHDTDLPLGEYTVHKLLLTALTALYYLAWRCFFPHLFLL
ncbi:MAG: hypothetical protein K2L18_05530 [Acetatifactor sp.]|nr:hypothetical protein [Acetatifactor sp.]